ncbi:hypothetical protein CONLIGDRAFT_675071 [Coniochaeta ligniaria NRRL 30616]|uniref:BTB domain-containing protein n=1 Tax=Coniochaeta ligniaria NRRL 30616 TaxID=1408157 RepID=A0A1J7I4T0_9PEZI|nr:hypothetical protein CONLIGDRAFT_675071 [Coniochaeta ligniaria NRRL 30616]
MAFTEAVLAGMPPAQGPAYFDPYGDLRLEIGSDNAACIICSRALSRASPVFKKMLNGGFAESMPSHGEWVVKLPEDDPEAMIFLLNVVHGQFDDIPETLPEEKLYRLTILTDKYDMTKSLRPWASYWLKRLANTERTVDTQAQRMWIAWELGDAGLFELEVQYLLLNCTTALFVGSNADDPETDAIIRTLETLGFLETLAIGRTQMVTKLLGIVKQLLDSVMGIGQARPQTCEVGNSSDVAHEPSVCQAVVQASMLRALTAANLYPLPEPGYYVGTVKTLFLRLKTVASSMSALETNSKPWNPNSEYTFYQDYSHCKKCRKGQKPSNHSGCNPKEELISELCSAYSTLPTVVDETHLAHLAIQAKKSRMLP